MKKETYPEYVKRKAGKARAKAFNDAQMKKKK